MKRKTLRYAYLGLLGMLLLVAAAFATLHAAGAAAKQTAARPLLAVPAKETPVRPPPAAPEEDATIVDDPTVAPDPAESADRHVSFPSDI